MHYDIDSIGQAESKKTQEVYIMDFLHCSSISCTPSKTQSQLEHVLFLYRQAIDDKACCTPWSEDYIYHMGLIDAYYRVLSLMSHPVFDDVLTISFP